MVALLEYRSQVCAGCGGYLPDTCHPDYAELGGYVVDQPVRCGKCTALHDTYPTYEKSGQPAALRFHAHRRDE